jgi:putative spermidine/putrescine transport system substrate-binding protein
VTRIARAVALAAVVAALAVVVGFGSGDDSTSAGAPPVASTTASGTPDLTGQKLVWVGFGGVTGESTKKAWLDPFSKATGASVVYDSPSDPAKVKAMVKSGNVTWDVIDLDGGTGGAGCGTLFRTRQEMGIDISEVDPKYVSDACGVPIFQYTQALLYNKAKYRHARPTKITDFLDTKRFPGKRAMFNYAIGAWEPLIQAAGTPPDKVYPYKYRVGAKAYRKIKKAVVLKDELVQLGEMLSAGKFDMCMCYTGRAAIRPNVSPRKVGIVWDGAWNAYDLVYAIKGSRVPEAQVAMLNYLAKSKTQNAFTAIQPYEPTTIGPAPKVPQKFKYWMASYNKDKQSNTSLVDYAYLKKPGVADRAIAKWRALTSG